VQDAALTQRSLVEIVALLAAGKWIQRERLRR
jgi:hypothetical protein